MTEAVTEPAAFDTSSSEIREAFLDGRLPVAVYGLGKMGLPLAAVFGDIASNVTGVDVNQSVVDSINRGDCHVANEPGLPPLVERLVADGYLSATTDGNRAAKSARIHVVIIPTPITDSYEPDLSILDTVIETIGRGLDPGDLVLIESTVPPGTTEERVLPALIKHSGLDQSEFGLAFCPERTSSGRVLEDIRGAYPKVVGGVNDASTAAATVVYEEINDRGVIQTEDATTAEAVKVFEGLYRDVNIALANELAGLTDELDIDVRGAIDVANTQPYCDIHEPGPGVGGHCIPYYPYFVIDPFEAETNLLETARVVNDGMPNYTVAKLEEHLEAVGVPLAEASVVLLGLTYRPGVAEIRASPSISISKQLSNSGATVYGVDPLIEDTAAYELKQIGIDDLYEVELDAVLMVTPHEEFKELSWDRVGGGGRLFVLDGRDAIETEVSDDISVYTLGSGYLDEM